MRKEFEDECLRPVTGKQETVADHDSNFKQRQDNKMPGSPMLWCGVDRNNFTPSVLTVSHMQ